LVVQVPLDVVLLAELFILIIVAVEVKLALFLAFELFLVVIKLILSVFIKLHFHFLSFSEVFLALVPTGLAETFEASKEVLALNKFSETRNRLRIQPLCVMG
jgi:hypothetical protein